METDVNDLEKHQSSGFLKRKPSCFSVLDNAELGRGEL